jgi:deazaflavin-dependent oxidoreductase (nitroreductase family)
MVKRIAALAGVLTLGMFMIFLTGMRKKSPAVVDAVRKMNREVMNPKQMTSAGTPGAYASIIKHTGRTSGSSYDTPIGAVPTEDGFVIGLPYGTRADWLKNVIATGSATIVHEGDTYEVDQPEILPIEAASDYFSTQDQRAQQLFAVDQCLRVRRVSSSSGPPKIDLRETVNANAD